MGFRRRDLLIATGVLMSMPRLASALPRVPSLPRRLDLKNANTGESFIGPYRDRDGPIPSAVTDLAHFLRDHHADKEGPVSIPTLDFLADVMDAVGQTKATILSAYRTPETNRMLRERYFGVAEKSQHLLGKALDVTFDGNVAKAEQAALALNRGGVGWYPNSHFIHIDTGPSRHWELDYIGVDTMLLDHVPRHHILTQREMMARYRAYARREFMLRHRRKGDIVFDSDHLLIGKSHGQAGR
jgi:uncharacterized protein YcbK (DUF882 family)